MLSNNTCLRNGLGKTCCFFAPPAESSIWRIHLYIQMHVGIFDRLTYILYIHKINNNFPFVPISLLEEVAISLICCFWSSFHIKFVTSKKKLMNVISPDKFSSETYLLNYMQKTCPL